MSPKVPEAYLEARRKEILEAAYQCFMAKGFHNTTMQDIYDATKLSPGAVYNYFPSKDDIVIEVVKEYHEWTLSTIAPLISENPNESLINFIRFWLSTIKENDINHSFSVQLDFYSEASRNNAIREAMLKWQDATHIRLIEFIKRSQQAGTFNASLDPLAVARAVMGMIFANAIHKMLNPEVDIDAYEKVCEAMIKGIFSTPPKRPRKTGQLLSKLHTAEKEYVKKHSGL